MSLPPNTPQQPPIMETFPAPAAEVIQRRIPNIGHALLFLSFAGLCLVLSELFLVAVWGPPTSVRAGVVEVLHPKLQIAAEGVTYAVTLLAAWLLYPLLWHRGFLDGLGWRWAAARRQAGRLIPLGLMLGIMSGVVDHFFTAGKPPPIDQFFVTQSDAWLITFFGIVIAPVFEEICFRGFLVPAIAIAYDWLSLPHTAEARIRWQTTTALTRASLLFSAVMTSLAFALLHGQQVAFARGALLVLFCVSLALTLVRLKTQSVAASALVHGAYNGFIFITMLMITGGYRHLDRMNH